MNEVVLGAKAERELQLCALQLKEEDDCTREVLISTTQIPQEGQNELEQRRKPQQLFGAVFHSLGEQIVFEGTQIIDSVFTLPPLPDNPPSILVQLTSSESNSSPIIKQQQQQKQKQQPTEETKQKETHGETQNEWNDLETTPTIEELENQRSSVCISMTSLPIVDSQKEQRLIIQHNHRISLRSPFSPSPPRISQSEFVKSILLVLQGSESSLFKFNSTTKAFIPSCISIPGHPEESTMQIMLEFSKIGNKFVELEELCNSLLKNNLFDFLSPSLRATLKAFGCSLKMFLQTYRSKILHLSEYALNNRKERRMALPSADGFVHDHELYSITPSVLEILSVSQDSSNDIESVWLMCFEDKPEINKLNGSSLLTRLWKKLRRFGSEANPILLQFFIDSSKPILSLLQNFLSNGKINDPHGEFFLEKIVGEENTWTYFKDKGNEFIPEFLQNLKTQIQETGKAIQLVKLEEDLNFKIGFGTEGDNNRFTLAERPSLQTIAQRQQANFPNIDQVTQIEEESEIDIESSLNDINIQCLFDSSTMSLPLHEIVLSSRQFADRFDVDQLIYDGIISKILERSKQVGYLSISVLKNQYKLCENLNAIREYLLLNNGDFAESLCEVLFQQIENTPGPSWPKLREISWCLPAAMQKSGRNDVLVSSLTFLVFTDERSQIFRPYTIEAMNFLRLSFVIEDETLKYVLSKDVMKRFSDIWIFLMKIKRAAVTLRKIWLLFKNEEARNSHDKRMHSLCIFRNEMEHFVRSLQNYVFIEALGKTWNKFQSEINSNVSNVESLCQLLETFINEVEFCCLLQKKAATISRIFDALFNLVLQFHVQAQAIIENTLQEQHNEKSQQPNKRQSSVWLDKAALLAQKTRTSFQELSHAIFDILSKLCYERGFQPSLHHLLTVLDFNNFYEHN